MQHHGCPVYFGAGRNLEDVITTHLFGVTLNHAGSSFLIQAIGVCRAAWNMPLEGHWSFGYTGPRLGRGELAAAREIWGSRRRWRKVLTDRNAYDWPRIHRAWYFQARAGDPRSPVFVTKSPPHLLVVDDLARYFPNPKFLFMVRNPYAVCEGLCRHLKQRGLAPSDGSLPEAAARHVVACLRYQRRNIAAHGRRGVFFTYETMCAEPERVASEIRALVPELDDLNLRQRLRIRRYNEMLTDMNPRHLARLEAGQIAAFNRVFRPQRSLLAHFGYEIMGARP